MLSRLSLILLGGTGVIRRFPILYLPHATCTFVLNTAIFLSFWSIEFVVDHALTYLLMHFWFSQIVKVTAKLVRFSFAICKMINCLMVYINMFTFLKNIDNNNRYYLIKSLNLGSWGGRGPSTFFLFFFGGCLPHCFQK